MKRRVLILDDDKDLLEILEAALEYSDYKVKATQYIDDIDRLLLEFAPDIILIDFLLHGTNGGVICRKIKADPLTQSIPIVIISAYPGLPDSADYYGCDALIPKPFDLSELLHTMQLCMSYKSSNIPD